MIMTGKPSEVPLPKPKPATSTTPVQKGPSYNDAFAQFLQQANKSNPKPVPKAAPPAPAQPESQPVSVIQETPKSNRGRKKKSEVTPDVTNQPAQWISQQQAVQNQSNLISQNQRVTTERIPQNQPYAIQENTVLTQDGKHQKLYYTILNSPNNGQNLQQQMKMNPQYGMYGQQSF